MFRNDKRQDENVSQSVWNSLAIVSWENFLLTIVFCYISNFTPPVPHSKQYNLVFSCSPLVGSQQYLANFKSGIKNALLLPRHPTKKNIH